MPNTSKKIKGNKGEWSEFYAFLRILSSPIVFSADKELNPIKGQFYTIKQIVREDIKHSILIYDLSANSESIRIHNESGAEVKIVPRNLISRKLKTIFSKIKTESSPSLSIPECTELMKQLMCRQLKSPTSRKEDIILVLNDPIANLNAKIGFSIKSTVGGASTLLNSSGATNFVFRVDGLRKRKDAINSIDTRAKIRDRIGEIMKNGGRLRFVGVTSDVFEKNLRKIDTILPNIISEMLKTYYSGTGTTVKELLSRLSPDIVREISGFDLDRSDFEFKIKNFLLYVALGLVPSKSWDGILRAYGGYIIVREDGNIVCYHMYNMDAFSEYLYANTRFDTPSTSRHRFGSIYKKNGHLYINLNLQIRFTR